ncbi:MAG: LPS assembly protein LptD [Nitrospirae bacterium]|nr:LPS assembly protein LptD [Nitrospirota bacterium]
MRKSFIADSLWLIVAKSSLLMFCAVLQALCFFLALPVHARMGATAKPVDEGFAPRPGEGTTITSDSLEYDAGTFTYTAKGHAVVKRGPATVEADEMSYNEETSELTAEGSVVYDDPDVIIRAKRADLDLELKTGTLYEAEIYSRKDNYHVSGLEIERVGEKEYTLRQASFTTCDAPVPAWCFRGSDVDVLVGDRLKAKNVTFNIENQPVLYSPYFSAGLSKERKTGFLMPVPGYTKSKGVHYEQPFFWAISDNKDATISLDVYTGRGVGESLEYRFLEPDGSKGDLWAYHLRDNTLKEDFWDLKGVYDRERDAKLTGYLSLNYINSRDFYTEYDPLLVNASKGLINTASYLSVTTGRFLESTGEVSLRFENDSRLFLASQYLVDLKEGVDQGTVAQRLPEAGYFMNPRRIGPVVFSLASTLSNFWRERDVSGQRFDLYPRIAYSFGSDIVISQTLGLRETAYSLVRSDGFGSSPHRESFDYSLNAQTRLTRKYPAFIHVIEPSLGYTFRPSVGSDLPLFDSTELYTKTSTIQLSVLNRFMDDKGEFLTVRITQPFDSYMGDRPFLPLKLEAAIQRPLLFRGETEYDVNTGRIETINSDVGMRFPPKMTLTMGERYNRLQEILFFSLGLNYAFSKTISTETNLWYDAKSGGLRDFIAKIKYQKQCWGVDMIFAKRESDFSVSVLFNLLGLGTVKL